MTDNAEYNKTVVLSYAIYMANKWSESEAVKTFGKLMGEHIWGKWVSYNEMYGTHGASMKLIYELDDTNLKILVERANTLYEGRKSK